MCGNSFKNIYINKGVRHFDVLPSLPFNLYFSAIFNRVFAGIQDDIKINEVQISSIGYAENKTIIVNWKLGLQQLRDITFETVTIKLIRIKPK